MAAPGPSDPETPGRGTGPRPLRLDPTNIDLTNFDVVAAVRGVVGTSGMVAARAADLAKDATYVTVGLGLLSYQRAQVRRREFERSRR